MSPPFFSDTDVDRVEKLLKRGLSYREIARELGCDKSTVSSFIKRSLPEWYERRRGHHNQHTIVGLRRLVIDIETRPNLAYIWDVWQRYTSPERIIDEKEIISFAAKWVDSPDVEFWSTFHNTKDEMIHRAHELLDEADGVITYNGVKFDLPHFNLEFLRNGFAPPSPYKSIDLYQTVRRKFKFTSNKLQYVASKLGLGSKMEHEGFALWEKCMANDKGAWGRMREYNIQDVRLTEELYHELLPWIEGHPSFAAHAADEICPNCGSEHLESRGYYRTKTGTYVQYQCGDCGKWVRDTKRSFNTKITETAAS